MPRDLFAMPAASPNPRARRSSLLVISGVMHAALLVALLVVTILAPDILPSPHAAGADWDFTLVSTGAVVPPPPPPPPPVAPPDTASVGTTDPGAFPAASPDGIGRENAKPLPPPPDGILQGGDVGTILQAPLPPMPVAEQPSAPRVPVRVFAGVEAPRKLQDAAPIYPVIARTTGVQGLVILEATIDATGSVVATKVLRSVPLLDAAAVDAVRQWKYEPARLNGEAIPVLITVTVNFVLGGR